MDAAEHHRLAESLLRRSEEVDMDGGWAGLVATQALVHATLALVDEPARPAEPQAPLSAAPPTTPPSPTTSPNRKTTTMTEPNIADLLEEACRRLGMDPKTVTRRYNRLGRKCPAGLYVAARYRKASTK